MPSDSTTVAVSAPGKVLFAGGFLVLDRQHTGLVFGLNARIHVLIGPWQTKPQYLQQQADRALVLVQSPQFRDASWLYAISPGQVDGGAVEVTQLLDQEGYTRTPNKFVETTLRYALTYLSHVGAGAVFQRDVKVTILADNDYYSAPGTAMTDSSTFTDFGVRLSEAHKTGLGSSAALTTALVGALLETYAGNATRERKEVVHNLAQAAHCAAQGKVGSGFDVAAAVYGSCLYRRFTPIVLESLGEPNSTGFGERLHRCVENLAEEKWDVEILADRVKVPEGLLLLLCDVDCGSETPGMVRKMLAWRKEKPEEAGVLWGSLQLGQEELCEELGRLSILPVEAAGKESFAKLRDTIETTRSLVREMSGKSGVPVEPEVITELLDHCSGVEGVVGGVAPGAGGYDAVALLVRNDTDVVTDLQKRLQGWKSKRGGAEIGNVRLLGVKQEREGVRREDAQRRRYQAWIQC
ncbi:phosphomevalonate kinase [Cyphellophora europaea CBS 101466]|uniref:Phosphomevalonate kinase n=1 Tax=Cyphellophora europaea (strain CBS 101466) TaxID=1220924 RepID=W2S1J4_CYPE1|nr:phosphomevalonate kinase [Cyphellophora europaea CBS 101466]ETN41903.1 phosphomevalonate kinase [Cyphellophora europaea CBS 101466]